MTYRQIETSREIRLWVTQIIVPAAAAVGTVLYMNPELRAKATTKAKEFKCKIETKFKK